MTQLELFKTLIRCMDNRGFESVLTNEKVYEVHGEKLLDGEMYWSIENDKGRIGGFRKWRFEPA